MSVEFKQNKNSKNVQRSHPGGGDRAAEDAAQGGGSDCREAAAGEAEGAETERGGDRGLSRER